jgi:adenylate kinase family enzyme
VNPAPRRIWVVGVTGSGKSTLARELGGTLNTPVHELDNLYWRPGWTETRIDEFISQVQAIVEQDSWILAGSYQRVRQLFLDRIELLVWPDLPFRITFPRILARSVRRAITREPCCNGNHESFPRMFFRRDSLLWWAISMHRQRRRELGANCAGRAHVRLRSQREIDQWLTSLQSVPASV